MGQNPRGTRTRNQPDHALEKMREIRADDSPCFKDVTSPPPRVEFCYTVLQLPSRSSVTSPPQHNVCQQVMSSGNAGPELALYIADPQATEERLTPLTILIASMIILGADYLIERYFQYRKSPRPGGFFVDPANNWLRNPLRRTQYPPEE